MREAPLLSLESPASWKKATGTDSPFMHRSPQRTFAGSTLKIVDLIKTLVQPGGDAHQRQPLDVSKVMGAFQNPAEECRLMEALQYQVRITSNIIRSHLHRRWWYEQEQRPNDPLRAHWEAAIRIQSHVAIPLEAPITPIPRAFKQDEKLDMKKETVPGGRFFTHASVYSQPETRKVTNFVNLTLIAAATELLEMAEKEADLTSEAPKQPSYLTFGKRCWSGMPEGEPEYGEWRVRLRRPPQQSTAFMGMAVALRGSCTTDQAVDCGSRHVNCCVCASCRRWTLCPTECRMCAFSLEIMVGRFKDKDEVLTETMSELHDRLYYQLTYLQGAPGGALGMYPYQRNPNDIADRLPTRIRWKNLVLSVNDVPYFNSVAECEQCKGTHNYLRPKGKPMPFLMGSASYKEMSDSDAPPEFNSVYVRTCPDPDEKEKPIEHHIRDADEYRGRSVGHGAAEETRPRIVREASLARPVHFEQVVRQRVPEDFSTGASRPLDEPQAVLDQFIATTKQPMGGSSDPAKVFNTADPIGEEQVATPHFVHTRNCGSVSVGWRRELQQTIHDSIFHAISV